MKSIVLLFCMISFCTQAQELFFEYGLSNTEFDYTNTQDVPLDNLQATTASHIALGTRMPLLEEKIQFVGKLHWQQYGAIGSDDALGNYFEWHTNYVGVQLGLDAKIITSGALSWHILGGLGPEFIIQGTQRINNSVFNLVGAEDFDSPNIRYSLGTQFEYELSDILSLAVSYQYGRSNTLRSSENTEELSFIAHQIGAKMYFDISTKETVDERAEKETNPSSKN